MFYLLIYVLYFYIIFFIILALKCKETLPNKAHNNSEPHEPSAPTNLLFILHSHHKVKDLTASSFIYTLDILAGTL